MLFWNQKIFTVEVTNTNITSVDYLPLEYYFLYLTGEVAKEDNIWALISVKDEVVVDISSGFPMALPLKMISYNQQERQRLYHAERTDKVSFQDHTGKESNLYSVIFYLREREEYLNRFVQDLKENNKPIPVSHLIAKAQMLKMENLMQGVLTYGGACYIYFLQNIENDNIYVSAFTDYKNAVLGVTDIENVKIKHSYQFLTPYSEESDTYSLTREAIDVGTIVVFGKYGLGNVVHKKFDSEYIFTVVAMSELPLGFHI